MPTHFRGGPREVLALDTFIKLSRAGDTVDARLAAGCAELGITLGQLGVLEALLHLGPMRQGELGRKLLRSNPNMTAVIDNLVRNGWVHRARSGSDRRVVQVSLTDEGRRLIESSFPRHAANIAEVMSPLSEEEQRQLGALCRKLGLGVAELGRRR